MGVYYYELGLACAVFDEYGWRHFLPNVSNAPFPMRKCLMTFHAYVGVSTGLRTTFLLRFLWLVHMSPHASCVLYR